MFGLSFPRFKSMAALQRAAKIMQEMGAAAKKELAELEKARKAPILNSVPEEKLRELSMGKDYSADQFIKIPIREPLYIDLYSKHPSSGNIRSLYRDEELTREAVRAGFKGAMNEVDVMRAMDACHASPHFTVNECGEMAVEALYRSSEIFIPSKALDEMNARGIGTLM